MDPKMIGNIVGGIIGVVIFALVVMNIMKKQQCTANGKSAMDNLLEKLKISNSKEESCNFIKTCSCSVWDELQTKTTDEQGIYTWLMLTVTNEN